MQEARAFSRKARKRCFPKQQTTDIAIKKAISQQGEEMLTCLMVGVVALEQLPDLATLGIVTPAVRSRWFARDPDLIERIASLVQEGDAHVRKNE